MKPDFEVACASCGISFSVKRKRYLDRIRINPSANFFCNDDCYIAFRKTGSNIICLVCNKSFYRSKRDIHENYNFCSTSCSATYYNNLRKETGAKTTKGKTKEFSCTKCGKRYIGPVNTPISTGLCESCKIKNIEKECESCRIAIFGSPNLRYCISCRTKIVAEKIQVRINNGKLFSKSIKCLFVFKDNAIKCDSKLEYACLQWFINNFDVLCIKRAEVIIPYTIDNKIKNYYPDFEIQLSNGSKYLVECKGVVGKKLSDKWNDYNRKSVAKKIMLNQWCLEHGFIPFWFDQKNNEKIYKSIVLPISDSGESA